MANIILGFPNRTDTSTLSGGSWTGLANLKIRDTYSLARTTDATLASTQFDIDLGTSDYNIHALSLHSHNLSSNATWRITVGTSAGASDVFDSGFISVWSVTFDSDLNQFEQGAYWPDVTNDANVRSHFSIISTFSNAAMANQYIRVEINDTTNTDGYIEIGRLGVWSGFQPSKNAVWGINHGWDDQSDTNFSISGELNYEKRKAKRTANMSFDFLTDSEANTMYELVRRSGTTGEVMYIPDPADMAYSQRYGFRGRLRRLGALEKTSIDVNTQEIQAEELI